MIRPVAAIGPQSQAIERREKKGGGQIGQAIGAVAGGVVGGLAAGTATGGAATGWGVAQGAMLGGAAGGGLGQAVGNAISPARAGSTAIQRRAEMPAPQLQQSEKTEALKQSIMALHSQDEQTQQQYGPKLVEAYLASVAQSVPKQPGVA